MTKRYYISRVIGDGSHETPYNSELRQYIVDNWPDEPHFIKQVIHAPTLMWCIMKYDLSQEAHDDVMANCEGIFDFPAGALDRTLAEIPPNKRNAIRNKLESVGFSFGWATLDNTVRDVLAYVIHSTQLASWALHRIENQNFDIHSTVGDIPADKRQKVNQHLQDLGVPTGWITLSTPIWRVVKKIMFQDDETTKRLFGTVKKRQWFWHDEDN